MLLYLRLYIVPCLIFVYFFFNDTATTEIYTLSLHDALPISVERISELMYVYGTDTNNSNSFLGSSLPISYPNYVDYRSQNDAFTDMGAYSFPVSVSLGEGEKPIPVSNQLVSGNYFSLLGVHVT